MKKIVLAIMDGVGYTEEKVGNAVAAANTPNLDYLLENYPNILIKAHGTAVGLPTDEDMGNSEVGHNALGCGQIYSQGAKRVDESIETQDIFESKTYNEMIDYCKSNNGTFHFLGLLSDGNVHSNIKHLLTLLEGVKKSGIAKARVHILLDGRDVPPQSADTYIEMLENKLSELNDDTFDAKIASGGGRMYITMDRYKADWEMVERGYNVHVLGEGKQFKSALEALKYYREQDPEIVDQDIHEFVIADESGPVGTVNDGDAFLLFNFRGDRALEISMALEDEDFPYFERKRFPKIYYAGMLEYDAELGIPKHFLVEPPHIKHTLTEELVKHNINEYAVSETQKFGHVTYFWNGNRTDKFNEELETYKCIDSDTGITFDEKPRMKAIEISEDVVEAIKSNKYDFIRLNYPNGDMVGHTGNYEATIKSLEAVDEGLGLLQKACEENGYTLIVTADHGNSEVMYTMKDDKKVVKTSHTTNPVPFIICDKNVEFKDGEFGLSNVAATILQLMGLDIPEEWNESMIK